jgi:hypothetical protein
MRLVGLLGLVRLWRLAIWGEMGLGGLYPRTDAYLT